jgi:IclR family transcriptional regulator, acetate operon repressor
MKAKGTGRFDLGVISEHRRTAEPMQANFPELSEMAQVVAAEFGAKVSSRVAVLDESFAVVIGRVDGPGIIHFESNLARQELPHCSALGKVLLSQLSEQQVRAIVGRTGLPARTSATITDVEWLLRELEEARARGFAVDDEEDSEGVFCVAAPVLDRRGTCVAAISVTGLKLSLPVGGIEGIGQIVRRYAAEISVKMGAGEDAATHKPIG